MNKTFGLILGIFFMGLASASLNVQLSDQGTGVANSSGDLQSGDLTVLVYDAASGGNLIYNETFSNAISNGSWNVMLGSNSPITNLSLEFGKVYYKDYLILGEDATFDGNDRQAFYSPLGDINSSDLVSGINLSDAVGYLYSNLDGAPAGTDTVWNITTSNYLINQSGILYLNETKLNETIDARAGGDNSSWNESYADTKYILQSNEANLNVNSSNSSTWWASVSGWVSGWFVQTGNDLDFNETKLNETIDARAVASEMDPYWTGNQSNYYNKTEVDTNISTANTSMKNYVDGTFIAQADEANLNVNSSVYSNSSTWWASISGWVSGWFVQTGNDLDFNETKLNGTIDSKIDSIGLGNYALTNQSETFDSNVTINGFVEIADDLNVTSNNITQINCLIFDSGGKICSS